MRKYLIILLIVIFSIILLLAVKNGYQIGNLKALSISEIKKDKEDLESKIEQMTVLTTSTYETKMSNLTSGTKEMLLSKADYNDLVTFSSTDEIKEASRKDIYDIEYLWAKIGNYATKNGVTLKMDVQNPVSDNTDTKYDLSFNATGQYISISDFVYDLEDDDSLGFKIEDFALTPSSGDTLSATFTVKGIIIKLDKDKIVTESSDSTSSDNKSENVESKDKTNTTENNKTSKTNTASAANNTNNKTK